MKGILSFCILLVTLCIASSVQSWEVYNRSTAADSELLDGLDSTAFTLQSTFDAYTSTAGSGGGSPFDNITVTGVAVIKQLIGGVDSFVVGSGAVIAGGNSNTNTKVYAALVGGSDNTISGNATYGFIGGGLGNYLGGVSGVIPGGENNAIYGDYGFLTGRYGKIDSAANRSWGDIYGASQITISASDTHIIYGGPGYEKKVGIQVLAPDDTLDVIGSIELNGLIALSGFTSIGVDYTVDTGIFFIECDATLGNISTTLPPVADKKGRLLEIKLLSASNGCYLDGNGAETIDGATGYAITAQYDSVSIIAGSSGWLIDEILSVKLYAQLSSSTDQTFGATGTPQSITLNTNDEISGITHSTTVNPENVTIVTGGVYTIIAQPQVAAGAGAAGYFHMWLQVDTGGGFADVPNSNIELILASNDQDVIPFITVIDLNKDDIIRLRGSVGDTGIKLDAQTPAGEPAIPAIIYSMHKI